MRSLEGQYINMGNKLFKAVFIDDKVSHFINVYTGDVYDTYRVDKTGVFLKRSYKFDSVRVGLLYTGKVRLLKRR